MNVFIFSAGSANKKTPRGWFSICEAFSVRLPDDGKALF